MPVLSESAVPGFDLPYVFLGGSLLLALGVVISRKSKKSPAGVALPPISEKAIAAPQEPYIISSSPVPMTFPQRHRPLHPAAIMTRPPPPLPFTPPTLSTTIYHAPSSLDTQQVPSSGGLNASYYQDFVSSPVELESPGPAIFDEPAALSGPLRAAPSSEMMMTMGASGNGVDFLPRRRSYTKSLSQSSTASDGSSVSSVSSSITVSGEVINGEGWRRHTRVFGGGVCKACEESERRMTA